MAKDAARLHDALRDFEDYADDVVAARFPSFTHRLLQLVNVLGPTEVLGQLACELLPEVDFELWYTDCLESWTGKVGSARLEWPPKRHERVAVQLELMRRLANHHIDFLEFSSRFMPSSVPDLNVGYFISDIFRPFRRDFLRVLDVRLLELRRNPGAGDVKHGRRDFVDKERIEQLKAIQNAEFDLAPLVRLCEELNICFRERCFYAVAFLTRAIMDHVPPIFRVSTFTQIVNNYTGTRSFKAVMQHMDGSARKIADSHLHTPVRGDEVLPTRTQVDFSNSLDVLLGEVVRLLKTVS
jgi:hypothetical protein